MLSEFNFISSVRFCLTIILLFAGGETIAVDQKDIERIKKVDQYVSCFINWRRGDVDAAVKMAISVLQWRKERNINGVL